MEPRNTIAASGRRRLLGKFASAGLVLTAARVLQSTSSPTVAWAQSERDPLVGSWMEEIVPTTPDGTPAPIPPLRGLVTFHADATVVGAFTEPDLVPAPPRATTEHGIWSALSEGQYAHTNVYFRVTAAGLYDRTVTLQGIFRLADDANNWAGTWSTVTTDGSGARIGTNQGLYRATRIQPPR